MSKSDWARLAGNMLAAFLIGEGLMVAVTPTRQTRLWSPDWSPALWRGPLRLLARFPRLTRLLALLEVGLGFALALWTNARPAD